MYTPTLHKPVPMNARVVVPAGYASIDSCKGRVVGIAFMHVIFVYIVWLDTPIETEYGQQSAVSVPGSMLEGEDGSNWKISNEA